ncbi:MAG: nuclear transport factor 2 family protein, partial [Deltaproteobacteria bacterium]
MSRWLASLDEALTANDHAAAAQLFHDESYWRDFVAFTWNIKTLEGREAIRAMLDAQASTIRAHSWTLDGTPTESGETVDAWFTFETAAGHGRGHIRLRDGKCFTLLTTLQGLTAAQLAVLTTTQMQGFIVTQLASLTTTALQGLTAADLGSLTANQIQGLSATQIRSLTTVQIGGLTSTEI